MIKHFAAVAMLGLTSFLAQAGLPGTEYFLFKASVTLAVADVIVPPQITDPEKVITKTLNGNDLINLAQGRPLGTKIDAKLEMLALAVAVEGPGQVASPKSRVVVINPDKTVVTPNKVLATVFTVSSLNYDQLTAGKSTKGQGIGSVSVVATTTGVDPANNKFFASTLNGAGTATAPVPASAGDIDGFTFALKGLSGPLHIKYIDAKNPGGVEIDGILVKAMFTTSGKPVGHVFIP